MDKYSEKIVDSLKVFFLLEEQIKDSLSFLHDKDYKIGKMALRTLYIDLCAFIDELEIFIRHMYEESGNHKCKNNFILLTARPRKLLNKNDDSITYLRNTLFAHNFRRKSKGPVAIPWEELLLKYESAPVLANEMQILGEVAVLVIDEARKSFFRNEQSSFNDLWNSYEYCSSKFSQMKPKAPQVPENYIELLKKDMYLIKDALICHPDNYNIIAKKLGCSLVSPF